ncbi:hypothetical protein Mapa_001800 [Marchantia paleacea]|nr:hypothetical protein Mapa_001800 [Marchantia paleacea]
MTKASIAFEIVTTHLDIFSTQTMHMKIRYAAELFPCSPARMDVCNLCRGPLRTCENINNTNNSSMHSSTKLSPLAPTNPFSYAHRAPICMLKTMSL